VNKLTPNYIDLNNAIIQFARRALNRSPFRIQSANNAGIKYEYVIHMASDQFSFSLGCGSIFCNFICQKNNLLNQRVDTLELHALTAYLDAFLDPLLTKLENLTGQEFTTQASKDCTLNDVNKSCYLYFDSIAHENVAKEPIGLAATLEMLPTLTTALEQLMSDSFLTNSCISSNLTVPVAYSLGCSVLSIEDASNIQLGDMIMIVKRFGVDSNQLLVRIGTNLSFVAEITAKGFCLVSDNFGAVMVNSEDSEDNNLDAYGDLGVRLDFEVGSTEIKLSDLANIEAGYIFTLPGISPKTPIAINCGARRVGYGELVSIDDDRLAVRLLIKEYETNPTD